MRSQTQTQLLIKRHFKTIFFRDSTHSAHGISQPPLVQDLSVLKMKNPFKMFNEKKGSCVAIFGKTKVSSIESTERLLECGGGQKFFWMESWWSPVDRLGGWWRKWGRCGRVLVPSPVDGVQWGSLPPSCSNTHHPASRAPIQLHLCPHLTQFGFHVKMFLVIFTGTKVLKRMKVLVWC